MSFGLRHTVAFGDFFLQKKHITAINRKNLADFSGLPEKSSFQRGFGTSLNHDVI